MKTSEVLRRAAEAVDGDLVICSCDAISFVAKGEKRFANGDVVCGQTRQSSDYASVFSPDAGGWRWGDQWDNPKECRVIALCLAAAISESSGD